jgi:hypothetical protein
VSNLKVISDRSTKDKTDSMWYRSSDHTPIRVVEYKGRQWVMWAMGEVSFTYKDERYYCLSECTDITNDDEFGDALDNGELDLWLNNWYEIRPSMSDTDSPYYKYVNAGLYDDVYGSHDELDKDLLDLYLKAEREFDERAN